MAKLTLADLASLTNQTSAIATINANNALIETALENTLSRDGTTPNTMGADLDMNSNQILNLPAATLDTEPIRKAEFDDYTESVAALVAEAEASADLATTKATEAAGSASAAAGSASSAAASLVSVLDIFDQFDDIYYGAKASDPTVDNDGNAITTGDIYFNTTAQELRAWNGSLWTGFIGTATTNTLTNKTINLANNTVTGTLAQFNTALSDGDFVSIAGTETLTNKTLTTPTLTSPTVNTSLLMGTGIVLNIASSNWVATHTTGVLTVGTGDLRVTTAGTNSASVVTVGGTQTLTNKTLTSPVMSTIVNSGTLTLPTSTDTLVGRATTDTLTNKTINLTSNTFTGTTAQFNTALSDNDFATLAGSETLTNKTVNLTSNTLTGTRAQFNTAMSDDDFVSLTGTETLTNKTLTSPTINTPTLTVNDNAFTLRDQTDITKTLQFELSGITTATARTLTVPNISDTLVTLTASQTLTNKTLTAPVISTISNTGTVTLPTATTTLVGRDTTDTLTNKSISLTTNTLTGTSAELRTAISDETGSGALVFATSPTLVTPILGTPTSGTLTNCTGLPVSTGISGLGTGVATFLATPSSANLISAVTDETGTGALVFATSPTLVTPILGTPTSGTLTNCTGLPVSTGIAGLGAGVATFLATPSSANLIATVTDETGSGSLVFATSPTLVTPILGTPTSGTLTNCTGLPVSTGISGLGTGVATFLATPSSANLITAITDETGSGSLVFATSPTITTPTISSATLSGTALLSQALRVTGIITPTQITANTNDYAPSGFSTASIVRISTDATRNLTGLAGGADGRTLWLWNVGAANLIITDEDANSTAANRFALDSNVTLAPDQALQLQYDATASRWRIVGGTGGGGGGGGDALTTSPLSQFASTTSAQLAGVMSDETGSGALVFGTSPSFTTDIRPASNDGAALGTSTLNFSDLFLASGAVVNFNNGDVTVTHSANTLTFGGASSGYLYDAVNAPSTNDGAALGTSSLMWSDLFLASGAVVNFNNGDVTVTHSSNKLDINGGVVDFDQMPTVNDTALSSTFAKSGSILASGSLPAANSVDIPIDMTGYSNFAVMINGMSHNNGTNRNAQVAYSDDGTNFNALRDVTPSIAAASTANGLYIVFGGGVSSTMKGVFHTDTGTTGTTVGAILVGETGVTVEVRISLNSTGNFDAGTYLILGF